MVNKYDTNSAVLLNLSIFRERFPKGMDGFACPFQGRLIGWVVIFPSF